MSKFKFLLCAIMFLPLISCGGSGSSSGSSAPEPNPTPSNQVSLSVSSASIYPVFAGVNTPAQIFFTVTNSSNQAASVSYTFPASLNTTGGVATAPTSCTTVMANSSCTGSFSVSNASAGGVGFTVNGTSSVSSSIVNKIKHLFAASATDAPYSGLIDFTELPENSATGADGINVLYPPQIIATSESGYTQVKVVAAVNSINAGGNFNQIGLVDQYGNKLNYTVLSSSGNGLTNLSYGSVVTFTLNIPSSNSSFNFYVQTYENNTVVGNRGDVANVIRLLPYGTSVPIISVAPSYSKVLNAQNTTQEIIYTNTGTADASNLQVASDTPNIVSLTNNGCVNTLAVGVSCTVNAVLNQSAASGLAGTAQVSLSYSAAGGAIESFSASIPYAGSSPSHGISITDGGIGNITFNSTTANPSESTLLTLTNIGSIVESNFVLLPPGLFTINSGNGSSCSIGGNGNTITNTLQPGASCTFNMVYTNNQVTAASSANLLVDYSYGVSSSDSYTVALNYSTTLAQASLTLSPSSLSFGAILSNNESFLQQSFTVTNSGDAPASELELSLGGTTNAFSLVDSDNNDCNNTAQDLEPGESCVYTIKFGPTGVAVGMVTNTATISYLPYMGATVPSSVTEDLSGTVVAPDSANMNTTVAADGFAGGDGSVSNPYQIESGSEATISISYTNTGNYPAESFYTEYNALLPIQGNFWTDISHGCLESSNITLESNNSSSTCTDKVGTANLPVGRVAESQTVSGANIWMFWTDQAGPHSQVHPNNLPPVYVNVYAPPSISYSITSQPQNQGFFVVGESFTITATLHGGYNVSDTMVTATAPDSVNLNITTCQLSSTSPSCTFVATVEDNDDLSDSINFANSGGIVQQEGGVSFTTKVLIIGSSINGGGQSFEQGQTFVINTYAYTSTTGPAQGVNIPYPVTISVSSLPTNVTADNCTIEAGQSSCQLNVQIGSQAAACASCSITMGNSVNLADPSPTIYFSINYSGPYLAVASGATLDLNVYDTNSGNIVFASTGLCSSSNYCGDVNTNLIINNNNLYFANENYLNLYAVFGFNSLSASVSDIQAPSNGGATTLTYGDNTLYVGAKAGNVYSLQNPSTSNIADIWSESGSITKPNSNGYPIGTLVVSSSSNKLYAGVWEDGSGSSAGSVYSRLTAAPIESAWSIVIGTSGQTSGPRYSVADGEGRVYVADNGSLYMLTEATESIIRFGQPAPIKGLALAGDQRLYVAQNDSDGPGICNFNTTEIVASTSGYVCPNIIDFPSGETLVSYFAMDRNYVLYAAFQSGYIYSYNTEAQVPAWQLLDYVSQNMNITGITAY